MLKKNIVLNYQIHRRMSDFVTQYNENHIPTTPLQKLLLSIGSATVSLLDPRRAGNNWYLQLENNKISLYIY